MEFWIGLSVGMHLGRVIAECLEKFNEAYGVLTPTTVKKIERIESAAGEVTSMVESVVK